MAVCRWCFVIGGNKMSAENSTLDNILSDVRSPDLTTKTVEFLDSTWQLAFTIEFYFQYVMIAIGVIGMVANALVLYALIACHLRESKKRGVNLLMINQNILDLLSCLLLIITFSVRVRNIYLTGALGYYLCTILTSENAIHCTMYASIINLMSITVERYLKVVHQFWSKRNLKRWMIHAAMVFAWIGGTLSEAPVVFVSTILQDGICLSFFVWESTAVRMIFHAWTVISYFFVPVIVFLFCYGRIVVVMRRQIRAMAAHNVEGSVRARASEIQSKRVKWNIVKTMIIVSAAFVVCWSPSTFYFVVVDSVNPTITASDTYAGYYATVFLNYLYICINPFIYAVKHEGVKEKLAGLMIWRGRVGVAAVADAAGSNSGDRNISGGTRKSHTGTGQTR